MKNLLKYIKESSEIQFVDAFILCNSELLLLRRANYIKHFGGKWCLPGGHIDNGESPESAIVREIKEETDITIGQQMMRSQVYTYDNGNKVQIFLINLKDKPDITISREHAQYKWISYNDFIEKYKSKFIPEQSDIVKDIYHKYIVKEK
jgi:mutator protein MutT